MLKLPPAHRSGARARHRTRSSSDPHVLLTWIYLLAVLLPTIAVCVRRLPDTDRSGWWYLRNLVPFGGIVLIVFYCLEASPARTLWAGPEARSGLA